MQWSITAYLLLLPLASALETVTVCRNTYSSGFLIQVIPLTSALDKRQESTASGYLSQDGYISHNCAQGSIWNLDNAQLSSSGQKVSASKDVNSTQFRTSPLLQAVNTKFATTDDFLFWDNEAFQDGTARFCATTGFNASLNAVFQGSIGIGCIQATLRTVSLSSCARPVVPTTLGTSLSIPSSLVISTARATALGNATTTFVPSSSSYSSPFITGVPAPSQNISSSSLLVTISSSTEELSSSSTPTTQSNGTTSTTESLSSAPSSSSTISVSTTSTLSSFTGRPSFSNGNEFGSLGSTSPSGTPSASLNSSSSTSSSVAQTSSFNISSTSISSPISSLISLTSNSSLPVSSTAAANTTSSSATLVRANSTAPISSVTPSNSTSSFAATSTSNSSTSITSTSSSILTSTSTSLTSNSSLSLSSTASTSTSSSLSSSTLLPNSTLISTSSSSSKSTSSASSSSSIPPFSEASSRIAENRTYVPWCSTYLGYTNVSQATVTVASTTVETSVTTATPAEETITEIIVSTKVSTVVTPSDSITVEITPSTNLGVTVTAVGTLKQTTTVTETIEDFTQIIQKRLASQSTSSISIPAGLESFAPSVISSACSANVPSPSALPDVTEFRIVTSQQIQHATASKKYHTVNVKSEVDLGVTIKSGEYKTTRTGSRRTIKFTTTITTTTTMDATATVKSTQTVPTIILAHPTAIVGSVNGSIMDYDDFAYNLTIPFEMQMYDHSSSEIWVSTNGLLSLDTGSWEYNNAPLPRYLPIPTYCMFPFWDDTYIYQGQPQGIYYEVTGGGNGTRIAFEFYLSHYHGADQYYHYTVFYDSADPGIFTFKYYQILDNGTSATVGMQDYSANKFTQYSLDTPDIYPGLELTLNSNTGVITSSNFETAGNKTSSTG